MTVINTPVRGFQSPDQIELLDAIDTLRAQGLGELVGLPQLSKFHLCNKQRSIERLRV
jgi:hypothetical protein